MGFEGPYSGSRHLFMMKADQKVHIPNPHRSDISKHLVAEILREANISPEQWDEG
jgi:predicted RNA binding protein YcfA (HicA-like mRNA interferase family)